MIQLSKLFVEHLVDLVQDFKVMFQQNIDEFEELDKQEDEKNFVGLNVPTAKKGHRGTVIKI